MRLMTRVFVLEQLRQELEAGIAAGNPLAAPVEMLEAWSADQAAKLLEALQEPD